MAFEPYLDNAKRILGDESSLDKSDRSNLWEIVHSTRDMKELSQRLANTDIPAHVEEALLAAKKLAEPKAPEPESHPVLDALNRLVKIDPKVVEIAESHPTVLRHFVDSALKEQ